MTYSTWPATKVDLAFPTAQHISPADSIPKEFWSERSDKSKKWNAVFNQWFFPGIDTNDLVEAEHTNKTEAFA